MIYNTKCCVKILNASKQSTLDRAAKSHLKSTENRRSMTPEKTPKRKQVKYHEKGIQTRKILPEDDLQTAGRTDRRRTAGHNVHLHAGRCHRGHLRFGEMVLDVRMAWIYTWMYGKLTGRHTFADPNLNAAPDKPADASSDDTDSL